MAAQTVADGHRRQAEKVAPQADDDAFSGSRHSFQLEFFKRGHAAAPLRLASSDRNNSSTRAVTRSQYSTSAATVFEALRRGGTVAAARPGLP